MGINSIVFLAAGTEKVTSERIGTALLNSLLCIIIVFLALIVISLIISLFKYIPKLEAYFSKKPAGSQEAVSIPLTPPQAPLVAEPEEELSDDAALVAVITAAIYAYEESLLGDSYVPADGIVVRSIKKANKSRWQKSSV